MDSSHLYSRKRPLPSRRFSFDETAEIKTEPLEYEETEESHSTEASHGYEEFERSRTGEYPLPNNIKDDLDFENILATLKLLMAVEDYLGSLGPKVVDLMTLALKMEKEKFGSSKGLLDSVTAVVLIEAAKEKLTGAVQAGLVPPHAVSAACLAVMRTAATLHEADKHSRALLQSKLGGEKETKSVATETEPLLNQPKESANTESHKHFSKRKKSNTSIDKLADTVDGCNIGSRSRQAETTQQLSLQELELLMKNYQNLPQEEQHGLKLYLAKLKEGPLPEGGHQLLQSFNHIFQEPVKIISAKRYQPATQEKMPVPTSQTKNIESGNKAQNKSSSSDKLRTKNSLTQETTRKNEEPKNVSSVYDKLTKEKAQEKMPVPTSQTKNIESSNKAQNKSSSDKLRTKNSFTQETTRKNEERKNVSSIYDNLTKEKAQEKMPTSQKKNIDSSNKAQNKSSSSDKLRTKNSLTEETTRKNEVRKNVTSIYDNLTKEKANIKLMEYIEHIEHTNTKSDAVSPQIALTTDKHHSTDGLNIKKGDANQVIKQHHTRKPTKHSQSSDSTANLSQHNLGSKKSTNNTQIAARKYAASESAGKISDRIIFEEPADATLSPDHLAKPRRTLPPDMTLKRKPSDVDKIKLSIKNQVLRPRLTLPLPKLDVINEKTSSSSMPLEKTENLSGIHKVKEKVPSTDRKGVQNESNTKLKKDNDKSKVYYKQGRGPTKIISVSQAYNSAKDSLDIRPPKNFRVEPEKIKTTVIAVPAANTSGIISHKKRLIRNVNRRSKNWWNIRAAAENMTQHDSDCEELIFESQLNPSIIGMFLPRTYDVDDVDEYQKIDQPQSDMDTTKDINNEETNKVTGNSMETIQDEVCEDKSEKSVNTGSKKKRRGKPRTGKGSKLKQMLYVLLRWHLDDVYTYHPSSCPNLYLKNYFAKRSTPNSLSDMLFTEAISERKMQLKLLASNSNIKVSNSERCEKPIVACTQNLCDPQKSLSDQPNEISTNVVVLNSEVQATTSLNSSDTLNQQPIANILQTIRASAENMTEHDFEELFDESQLNPSIINMFLPRTYDVDNLDEYQKNDQPQSDMDTTRNNNNDETNNVAGNSMESNQEEFCEDKSEKSVNSSSKKKRSGKPRISKGSKLKQAQRLLFSWHLDDVYKTYHPSHCSNLYLKNYFAKISTPISLSDMRFTEEIAERQMQLKLLASNANIHVSISESCQKPIAPCNQNMCDPHKSLCDQQNEITTNKMVQKSELQLTKRLNLSDALNQQPTPNYDGKEMDMSNSSEEYFKKYLINLSFKDESNEEIAIDNGANENMLELSHCDNIINNPGNPTFFVENITFLETKITSISSTMSSTITSDEEQSFSPKHFVSSDINNLTQPEAKNERDVTDEEKVDMGMAVDINLNGVTDIQLGDHHEQYVQECVEKPKRTRPRQKRKKRNRTGSEKRRVRELKRLEILEKGRKLENVADSGHPIETTSDINVKTEPEYCNVYDEINENGNSIEIENNEDIPIENVVNENVLELSHYDDMIINPGNSTSYNENGSLMETKTTLISSTMNSTITSDEEQNFSPNHSVSSDINKLTQSMTKNEKDVTDEENVVTEIAVDMNLCSVTDIELGDHHEQHVQECVEKPKRTRPRQKRKKRNRSGREKQRVRELKRLEILEKERNVENVAYSGHPIETASDSNVKTEPEYYNVFDETGTSLEIENTCFTTPAHLDVAALNTVQNSNLCGKNENKMVNSQETIYNQDNFH